MNLEELKQKYGSISIHITTKDRAGELACCLQSLRTQTYDKWNLILLCDASGIPTFNHQIVGKLLDRIRLEKHQVKLIRNEMSLGVCAARQRLINEDKFDTKLILRLDDDIICEADYLQKLVEGIDIGYDLVSGITPSMPIPETKRDIKFIKPIVDEIQVDEKGNIILYKDDCGVSYLQEEILPLHHFRSCALYKKEMNLQYPYGVNWFREESFLSIQAILKGYLLGVHTGAKVFHYQNQTGGCRPLYQQDIINTDQHNWEMWLKREFLKYKEKQGTNFLEDYNIKLKERGLIK